MSKKILLILVGAVLVAGVVILSIGIVTSRGDAPTPAIVMGNVLQADGFANPFAWENRQQGNVSVGVENGGYRIRTDVNSYVRGYGLMDVYEDVVVDVRVTQLSDDAVNAYGVVCRASADSNSANGYYFLISGDGAYSIRRGRQGDLEPIIAWERSSRINRQGFNQLRAVCIGDYLALWVNGVRVAQTRDSTFTQGRVGFAAAAQNGRLLDVVFSNLVISDADLTP